MSENDEKDFLRQRFGSQYQRIHSTVLRDIERLSHGCDYGGTSWTTQSEAGEIAEMLGLTADRRLLEVGAGSGWPGLYLVRLTGCRAVLLDVPLDGLRAARERAVADQTTELCQVLAADGAHLPFNGTLFDAVHHADVLCCMSAKLAMLEACRTVIRPDGTMVFTVIYVSPLLSRAEHDRAVSFGPPFVAADYNYPEMLAKAGWQIQHQADLTEPYVATARTMLAEETRRSAELVEVLGEQEHADRLTRRRHTIAGVEEGLLRRALYVVKPIS